MSSVKNKNIYRYQLLIERAKAWPRRSAQCRRLRPGIAWHRLSGALDHHGRLGLLVHKKREHVRPGIVADHVEVELRAGDIVGI